VFSLENFIEDCRSAVKGDPSHRSVTEVIKKAFRDPGAVLTAVGEPTRSGLVPIYVSKDVTILNVIWKPGMIVMPHNHDMWAVIGIYSGREDNIFWRRIKDDPDGRIEAAGAKAISTGDVAPLGRDIIHSVTNPISKLTGAIHVYGGDFFGVHVSEWDSENLTEHVRDMAQVKAMFDE
jgi:predicted metal-dependent enzyme (double-stranded beta helix superfamily)